MRQPDDPEMAAWLAKAAGDLRMARMALAAPDPLFDQACFHSQQAAEKALKALLVAAGIPVPKTHDLVHLVNLLVPSLPSLDTHAEAAAELSQHGVAPRYPSFLAPQTAEEARSALALAEEFLSLARTHLSL